MPPEHDDTDALLNDLDSQIDEVANTPSLPEEEDTDALLAEAEGTPSFPARVEAPAQPTPALPGESTLPWYHPERGLLAGAVRGFMGNLGTKTAGRILGAPKASPEGIPATYAGSTPEDSLEGNFQREKLLHPYLVGAGQIASTIPAAIAAGGLGAGLGVTAAEKAIGAGLGSLVPAGVEAAAEAQGSPGERFNAAENYFMNHPVATATGILAPAVGEAAAPIVSKAAQPLIDYGNRGLAKIGLSGAHLGKLLAKGGKPALAEAGAAMREAGLNKPRKFSDLFSPPDAEQMALNAQEATARLGGPTGDITRLENTLARTGSPAFGESTIPRSELTAPLRAEADSLRGRAASQAGRTIKALEKQARLFERPLPPTPPESVPPPIEAQAQIAGPPLASPEGTMPPPLLPPGPPQVKLPPVQGRPPLRMPEEPITDAEFEPMPPAQAPYTFNDALADKRAIGNQLFAKNQPLFQQRVGERKADEIAWQTLKDQISKRINEGVEGGILNPQNVADYQKAMRTFGPAADVAVDAGREAGRQMKRPEGLRGAVSFAEDSLPGLSYKLGNAIQKTPPALTRTVGAMLPGPDANHRGITADDLKAQNEQKQQQNENLKQSLFQRLLNKF